MSATHPWLFFGISLLFYFCILLPFFFCILPHFLLLNFPFLFLNFIFVFDFECHIFVWLAFFLFCPPGHPLFSSLQPVSFTAALLAFTGLTGPSGLRSQLEATAPQFEPWSIPHSGLGERIPAPLPADTEVEW